MSPNRGSLDAARSFAVPASLIYAEQVRHLFRSSIPVYPVTVVTAAVLAYALWGAVSPGALLGWLAAMVTISLARGGLCRAFLSRSPAGEQMARWARGFAVGAFAIGCGWGAVGSVLLPAEPILQFLVVALLVGMTTVALYAYSPVPSVFVAFMLPVLLPVIVTALSIGGPMYVAMATLVGIFGLLLLGLLHITHQMVTTSLAMRFENSALVDELTRAKLVAETSNAELSARIAEGAATEARLRESTDRLQALFEASPLPIVLQDTSGCVRGWNPAAARVFGWTEYEVLGRALPIVPEELATESARARARILSGELLSDVEARRQRKDGSRLVTSISGAPVHDAGGRPVGVLTIYTDITARKRSEERLLLSTTVTRTLAEAPDVMQAIDALLPAFSQTLGWNCAFYWRLEPDHLLRCAAAWSDGRPEIDEFVEAVRQRRRALESTTGIVRRVWGTGEAVWVPDLSVVERLSRRTLADAAGLRSALAVPIRMGEDTFGAVEFFSQRPREVDAEVLALFRESCSQVGQFMARKQVERNLEFVATHDVLTGLPNRAMFMERLSQALAQAARYHHSVAVLFVDLDGFKAVNDTVGHAAGDRLLREVADRLRASLREGDTVARHGGDEFVVLIEQFDQPSQVAGVAQKILDTLATPFSLEARDFAISASIGIGVCPVDGSDPLVLLRAADAAMYRAKQRGRNNHQFCSAQMTLHSIERMSVEGSLKQAIERNEFVLEYQPKVEIATGGLTGVEALIRWDRPGYGRLAPREFIAAAEASGSIIQIDEWVLRTACAQARAWRDAGVPVPSIAVNVSARQFAQTALINIVERALAESGLDPECIELEITETAFMRDIDGAVSLLRQLKAIGIGISIDDFGTGYSALGYLKRFPVGSVKIDRSFIEHLPGAADDAAIARAVIGMAHSLRLRVVAEGVENAEQLAFLREFGCDEAQGSLFSMPLAPEVLERHCARWRKG